MLGGVYDFWCDNYYADTSVTDSYGIEGFRIFHESPVAYCANTISFSGTIPTINAYVTPQNTGFTSAYNGVVDVAYIESVQTQYSQSLSAFFANSANTDCPYTNIRLLEDQDGS